MASEWFCQFRAPGPPRARLFCFHHAGGGAFAFRDWRGLLPDHIDLVAVQCPGRETRRREPPFRSLDTLLPVLLDQDLRPWMDLPYAMFGHSMGALIAYELIHRLSPRHSLPTALFVSARPAPHWAISRPQLHALPEPEFIAAIREYGGTPEEVLEDADVRALYLPVLRADLALCETWLPRDHAPLSIPLTAFGGWSDSTVSVDSVAAWQRHTREDFRLRMLDGDHFFIHAARQLVVRELVEDFERALSSRGAA